MGTPSLWPMVVLLVLAAVAACVARWGWRWRRVATPPTCRRCGYDVSGRPAGVETCSECGADLKPPRAIRTQRRVANYWIAAPATLACLALSVAWLSHVLGFPWRGWYLGHAPIAVLAWHARHDTGPGGDDFRIAWRNRDRSPAYVDHLLDLHGDLAAAWRSPFDDELTAEFRDGKLDAERQARFVRQLFGPATFRIRSPVRIGDPLRLSIDCVTRTSAMGALGVHSKTTIAARADGPAALDPTKNWSRGGVWRETGRTMPARDWGGDNLAPGPHRVNVKFRREVTVNLNLPKPGDPDPIIGPAVDAEATLDVDVLPAGSPIGTPVPAPEQGDAIARWIDVHVYHWHDGRCFAEVDLLPAAVDRSFSIYATLDGIERKIGGVCAKAGDWGHSNAIYVPVKKAQATTMPTLSIVLVGDGEPLVETIDQQHYWPGQIVFDDVPLETFDDYIKHGQRVIADARGPRPPTTRPSRVEAAR